MVFDPAAARCRSMPMASQRRGRSMQVSIETTSGLERRMTIGVPAKQVESEVEERLATTAKQVRLNGFRPGKVPVRVVRQRFGAGVRQEVLADLMGRCFRDAVEQE